MALPRKNRISDEKDFAAILKRGKTVKGSFFFIKAEKNDNLDSRRFGIVVPARVVKSAVQRNAVKRALTEAYRTSAPLASGYDIVCFLTKDCSQQLEAAESDLVTMLKQLL